MRETDIRVAAMLDTFRRAPIERDYSDKDLRAALGSSPPLEKMMTQPGKIVAPTPWRCDECSIFDADGILVAKTYGTGSYTGDKVLAKSICLAMNSHASNLALITELVGALTTIANSYATNPSDELRDIPRADYLELYLHEIRKMAREALAKAKVQP